MYKNKNYEWMNEWNAPLDREFPFDFIAYLYWMYMFNKLRRQGTQEDRLRLAVLYDEAVENEVTTSFGILSHNTSHYYKNAVTSFVYETRQAAINDDIEREKLIEKENRERRIRENNIKIYGYDPQEKEIQDEIYELELDEAGKNNPERERVIPSENKIWALYPSLDVAQKQKVVGELVDYANTFRAGRIAVHARIFDKINTYYTAVIWSDIRPKTPSGKQDCIVVYSRRYAGDDGILEKVELELAKEKFRTYINKFTDDEKEAPKKAKKARKVPTENDIDISTVTSALGLGAAEDDLNGDIF